MPEPSVQTERRWASPLFGGALVLYWALLFIATHVPMPRMNDLPAGSDKGFHFAAYAGLSVLLALWLSARGVSRRRLWILVPAVCLVYAMLDEVLQLLVSSRSADLLDGVADMAGAFAGLIAVSVFRTAQSRWKKEAVSETAALNRPTRG